MQYSIQGR